MRIFLVTPAFPPAVKFGGPALSVPSLAKSLALLGHDVEVVTTDLDVNERLDVPLGEPVAYEGLQVRYFRAAMRSHSAEESASPGYMYSKPMIDYLTSVVRPGDVVHSQLSYGFPMVASALSSLRRKAAFVHSARGCFSSSNLAKGRAKKALYLSVVERPLLRRASGLVALTEAEELEYKSLGINKPVAIIPNGVNVGRVDREDATREVKSHYGIDENQTVILFLARLRRYKGVMRLLDAFLKVSKRIPSAVLVIAGPDQDGLTEEINHKINSANATDRVKVVGTVKGRIKNALLARADLFCLPSDAEGFSNAVLEALANETAVLISEACNFPEVQKAGAGQICGLDSDSISEKLIEMASVPDQLTRSGLNGYSLVKSQYGWEHIAQAHYDFYQSCVARVKVI